MEAKFRAQTLQVADLDAMTAEFAADIDAGRGTRWMKTPESYSFSKIAVNALVPGSLLF